MDQPEQLSPASMFFRVVVFALAMLGWMITLSMIND
jgi:hypothetical protein